jgi:broad specificity phosphatase PhoE
VVDAGTSPDEWPLSDEGRRDTERLAAALPLPAYVVSSDEPKAIGTAQVLAGPDVAVDPRLREVDRQEPFGGPFRVRRRRWIDGHEHPGWESRADVAARIGSCVDQRFAEARALGRELVVVGHGMALTAWLATVVTLDRPGAFWEGLRLPDAYVVDTAAGGVQRLEPRDAQARRP